ncbi:MAG: 2Fe-2S iron-sulfur cluster-binding protein, partial [Roseobacter sp.]
PVKKWWWDIELQEDGGYHPARAPVNARGLQPDLKVDYADQTLAVYPAPLAPPPWSYPYPMERDAGIKAYGEMIPAETYQQKRALGETGVWDHQVGALSESPVIQMEVVEAAPLTSAVTRYVLRAPNGVDLPAWKAGAHIDVVITPDMLRQYSLCGDPAERKTYEIAVLLEEEGKGGSRMLHRLFRPGRRIVVSKPINYFPIAQTGKRHFLMGGGIGVTPMIAMAHALHRAGADFALHYSVSSRADAGFADILASTPWAQATQLHVSQEGTRADLATIFAGYRPGDHVYTCGPEGYMSAVLGAAKNAGFLENARHLEYFAVPDLPEYENHPFEIALKSGTRVSVTTDQSAAEALIAAGVSVDLKCSDGLCGVCKCKVLEGDVAHRDFVLSSEQQRHEMILCQSRAAQKDGVLSLDI